MRTLIEHGSHKYLMLGLTLSTYVPIMPNQARESAIRLSSKLAALLEGEVGANLGANISQLVVAEELPSSDNS